MSIFRGLRDHPRWLEKAYQFVESAMKALNPVFRRIGYECADHLVHIPEKIGKQAVFDCKMCGQCTLHFTGMTCPMTCPKNLRNGPCGGVRPHGYCEVDATMKCVWVEAFERSKKMSVYGDGIFDIQPPLNQQNMGRSAFINIAFLKNAEMPETWKTKTGWVHDPK